MKRISTRRRVVAALACILAALYFLLPLGAAGEFSLRASKGHGHSLENLLWIIHHDGFASNLWTSIRLAAVAALIVLTLMVPTVVLVNLGAARWKRVVEFTCIVPLVVPVVSLAIGAQVAMPAVLQNWNYELAFFYVIIALPYTFRTLDIGISAVPLKTLVEASRGLGGGWWQTLSLVIVPNIRTSVSSALFLTVALASGEFTITSLLHWNTFTTWTVAVAQENILGAIALSFFSLVTVLMVFTAFSTVSRLRRTATPADTI